MMVLSESIFTTSDACEEKSTWRCHFREDNEQLPPLQKQLLLLHKNLLLVHIYQRNTWCSWGQKSRWVSYYLDCEILWTAPPQNLAAGPMVDVSNIETNELASNWDLCQLYSSLLPQSALLLDLFGFHSFCTYSSILLLWDNIIIHPYFTSHSMQARVDFVYLTSFVDWPSPLSTSLLIA